MQSARRLQLLSIIVRAGLIVCAAIALVTAGSARPASANFHFAHINEIMSGGAGDDGVQYVEIRTDAMGQGVVGGSTLTVFQGASFTVVLSVATNLPNTLPQNRWIMATPNAATFLYASGISADYVFAGGIPKNNAMVCWGKPSVVADPTQYVDCVAYGGYSGTTPVPAHSGTATPLNAGDGQRSLTRIATADNNLTDYAFACPSPEDWAVLTGTFGPCGGTDTDADAMPDSYETGIACQSAAAADDGLDPDADGLTNFQEMNGGSNPCVVDTDGDGCSDGEERGPNPVLGGRRSPRLTGNGPLAATGPYDFYDVNGTKKVDSIDIALVRSKFNQNFPAYDRKAGLQTWAPGPPDGIVNAVDIGLVRAEFNHTCVAAP